jgi:hypothetical protein
LRKFIFSFDHMTSGFQCPSVYRQTRYTAKLPTAQKVAVCCIKSVTVLLCL